MRPCRIVFAVVAGAAFLFSGCQSPRRAGFLGGLFASTKDVEENPQQAEKEVFGLSPEEKAEGENIASNATKEPATVATIPAMNSHNQETLTYIDSQLTDATPVERKEWFETLKNLSADEVRLVLRTRRMSIELNRQKAERNSSGTDSYNTPLNLTDLVQNDNDYRSFQPGYTNTQNQTGMQPSRTGPYGDSDRQPGSHRSQPVRLSAPDLRQNFKTPNNSGHLTEDSNLGSGILPPPAPGVMDARSQRQPSSPMDTIQNPQQPISQSQMNNSVQTHPKPGRPLEIEKQGSNILWNEEILRVISLTESDVARKTPGTTDNEMRRYTEKHVFLRMLYLMAGKQAQAFEPIPRIPPADQEFWQQTLWGIANYFYAEVMPEKADRSAQTVAQIRLAIQRLQETANLEIKNVAFCKKITNFGNFEKFDRDEFRPGDTVLIYAEVENFKSESSEGGKFRTVMKSDIEILRPGQNGGQIDRKEYSPAEDFCSSPRRDYFHAYRYEIPPNATLGPHVLKLTIEDQLGGKVASYTMNFTIK